MHDYEQRNGSDDADGMPPLLIVDHPVRDDDMQRVIPDSACQLEGDVVLGEVGSRFGRIPFELHAASLYVHFCTYRSSGQDGLGE